MQNWLPENGSSTKILPFWFCYLFEMLNITDLSSSGSSKTIHLSPVTWRLVNEIYVFRYDTNPWILNSQIRVIERINRGEKVKKDFKKKKKSLKRFPFSFFIRCRTKESCGQTNQLQRTNSIFFFLYVTIF